jgi:hypothetical protein
MTCSRPAGWSPRPRWHADSALVEHAGYHYILAALAEHPDGGQWLAAPLHRLVVPAELAKAAE